MPLAISKREEERPGRKWTQPRSEGQFCLLHFKNITCDVILSHMHISSFVPNLSQSESLPTSPNSLPPL